MDNRRTHRVLIVAFVLSLVLHAVAVLWVRPVAPDGNQPVPVRVRVLAVTRHPPPTPVPSPRPPRRVPSSAPHVARVARPTRPVDVRRLQGGAHEPGGRFVGTPASRPTSTTVPLPCTGRETPVALVSPAPVPSIPPGVRATAAGGIARIRVVVGADGRILSAVPVASTGSPALDAIALEMAEGSQYAPARRSCTAAAGTYLFSVRFVAW